MFMQGPAVFRCLPPLQRATRLHEHSFLPTNLLAKGAYGCFRLLTSFSLLFPWLCMCWCMLPAGVTYGPEGGQK